jgi:hypothetical protein
VDFYFICVFVEEMGVRKRSEFFEVLEANVMSTWRLLILTKWS